ncbi:MAG: prephenate dehydratase [Pseudomonadota bacterium]
MHLSETYPDLKRIAFQGIKGAYSHLALNEVFPDAEGVACPSFEHAMLSVADSQVDAAMIPVENSQWGRVADVHHLLPDLDLYITGEYFHRVRHKLLGIENAELKDIKKVFSHPQALGQCRKTLADLGIEAVSAEDTAGSAQFIATQNNVTYGAIASDLAAQIYGLKILKEDLEDATHNTTRFLVMQSGEYRPSIGKEQILTSFIFETRNIPTALYKVLGGFATNGINIIRLESYLKDGKFFSSQFYAEIEGHPDMKSVQNAFEELSFFARHFKILGVYYADKFRQSE